MGAAFALMENKRNRVIDSGAGLALFRRNADEFLRRYIGKENSIKILMI